MKNVITLAIFVVLVLAGVSSAAVIYNDSFEGYTVGVAPPAPWNPWYASGTVVTNAKANTGSQSVNLDGGTATGVIGQDIATFYTAGSAEFYFNENGGAGATDFDMYITNGGSEILAELHVNYWGGISYKQNGAYTNILPGSLPSIISQWNALKVDYDTSTQLVDVFFNGTQIGTNLGMNTGITGTGALTRVYVASTQAAPSGSPVLIDDWSFNGVPEPATMALLGLGGLLLRRRRA